MAGKTATQPLWKRIPWRGDIGIMELFFIAVVAISTVVNVCITSRQWTAMVEQNRISTKTLLDTLRPWIGIDKIEFREPLSVDTDTPTFKLRFHLKNIGNSPAVVSVYPSVILNAAEGADEQKRVCTSAKAEIEAKGWTALYTVLPQYPMIFDPPDVSRFVGRDRYIPRIVGCVMYRATFDDTVRQSPFFGTVSVETEKNPSPRNVYNPIDQRGGPVGPDSLLVKDLWIVGDAN